jgi:hypothetical protein
METDLEMTVVELDSAAISVDVDDDDAALGFDVVGSVED